MKPSPTRTNGRPLPPPLPGKMGKKPAIVIEIGVGKGKPKKGPKR